MGRRDDDYDRDLPTVSSQDDEYEVLEPGEISSGSKTTLTVIALLMCVFGNIITSIILLVMPMSNDIKPTLKPFAKRLLILSIIIMLLEIVLVIVGLTNLIMDIVEAANMLA